MIDEVGVNAAQTDRAFDIRDAASRLFSERGYRGTRMQDIARDVGIRAPSLYNHVASKQDLLRSLMLEQLNTLLSEHHAAVASTTDVEMQLRRAMEAHVLHCVRHPHLTQVGSRDVDNLEDVARAEVLRLRREFGDAWVALLQRGVREGRFSVPMPRVTAYALVQMGVGVALSDRPSGVSESQLADSFAAIALRVVCGPRSLLG